MEGEMTIGEIAEPPDISGATAVKGRVRHPACVGPEAGLTENSCIELHDENNIIVSPNSRAFRERFFPKIEDYQWNDWRWQLNNRFTDSGSLGRILNLSESEKSAFENLAGRIPASVTPYYASLLNPDDETQALRKCVIPVVGESISAAEERNDPLSEDDKCPVPGIVHRYPDRVLFLATGFCSVYCRYCTRSRLMGGGSEGCPASQWEKAIEYIKSNPEIRDVLISGGDPLTLNDDSLEWLLSGIRAIPHVEFIRIGTKVPAVLPQRITPGLVRMLRRYHPLWMSLHFTHPDELTPETKEACERLADGGIPLGSQTVLLKGVNDDAGIMKKLMHGLLMIRVKPYYLYQCDPIPGSSHFRTPVQTGLDIIRSLRGFTSGYAVPQYVVDAPGGGGKIPLLPDYYQGRDGDYIYLKNYEGRTFRYPDPSV